MRRWVLRFSFYIKGYLFDLSLDRKNGLEWVGEYFENGMIQGLDLYVDELAVLFGFHL